VDLIARKRKERYCDVVMHVRTRIRFAILRTTRVALHGFNTEERRWTANMRPLYQKSHTTTSLPGPFSYDGENFEYIVYCLKFKKYW